MKKLLSLGVLMMLFSFAYAQSPEIEFKVKSYDFGKILKENGPVTTTFEFTNTGVAPLIIQKVDVSCGCTAPDYTKEPIPAGGKGFVKATFNAASMGVFNKSLTVRSNAGAEPAVILYISGEVISNKLEEPK